MCVFGSRTFLPISWMCKRQTSVSHSSTESEVMSSDAGLHMDGLTSLDLCDLFLKCCILITFRHGETRCETKSKANTPTPTPRRRNTVTEIMLSYSNVDHVITNATLSRFEAMPYIFEDNEAVIKMIIRGRSPTMRHVAPNPQSCTSLVI